MSILTHQESVLSALLASGRELTRRQLEAGASLHSFWDTAVAVAFNEATDVRPVDFTGILTGVYVSPVPFVVRTGPELR